MTRSFRCVSFAGIRVHSIEELAGLLVLELPGGDLLAVHEDIELALARIAPPVGDEEVPVDRVVASPVHLAEDHGAVQESEAPRIVAESLGAEGHGHGHLHPIAALVAPRHNGEAAGLALRLLELAVDRDLEAGCRPVGMADSKAQRDGRSQCSSGTRRP